MKIVALLLILLGIAPPLCAQPEGKDDRALLGSNAEGTHFVLGFMQNEIDNGYCARGTVGQRLIMIASRFDASVTVTLPNGQTFPYQVRAGGVVPVEIQERYEMKGEGVFTAGIDVQSDRPISVYCFNGFLASSDGYLALPVSSWGTEYVIAAQYLDVYPSRWDSLFSINCNTYPRGGELAVIASEDSTVVTIYPKARILGSPTAGGQHTRILNRGQILQVQDNGSQAGRSDLTGSVIATNRPVGVLSGHVRAGLPVISATKNHLIEMIPPRNVLGRRYICIPFGGRQGGDIVRVISSVSGPTSVTFAPVSGAAETYVIPALGEWTQFELKVPTVITTGQPALVAHYSKSMDADPRNQMLGANGPVKFDPYMIIVTPEEQFINASVFQTMPNISTGIDYPRSAQPQFTNHYLTLVGEQAKFGSIRLDGQPLASYPGYTAGLVNGTPYAWATLQVSDGAIHTLQGDALFGGYVYGLGQVDAYGWPVGAGIRKFDLVDNNPPALAARRECGGYEITAREKGPLESGLLKAWLDSSWSQNVVFRATLLIIGDEYSLGHVTIIDPSQPARARIVAEDLSGNRDTIEVNITFDALDVLRDSVLFRDVELSQLYRTFVTVTNPTTDTITIDSAFLAERKGFLLPQTYRGVVIAPGDSIVIEIMFGSDIRMIHRDTLFVFANCVKYPIPLTATMGIPGIATHDLEFGTIRKGRTLCLEVKVSSTGSTTLRLDSLVIELGRFTIAVPLVGSVTLPPGTDTTFTICFQPDSVGEFTGRIRFISNADSVAISSLHGRGAYPILSVGSYDYGRHQVGDTLCATVPITNIGGDTAHVTGLLLTDSTAFLPDLSVFPRFLAGGDTLWVRICFVPTEEQIYPGEILARNSDGLESSGSLYGEGYRLRASINGYDWKERRVGTRHDTVVYVRNLGASPIQIDRVWIEDGDVGDFNVEPLPAPAVVAVGDSLPIAVQFNPLLPGDRQCHIKAATSSRQTPELVDILHGFGLMPLSSDRLTFTSDTIYSCGVAHGELVIFNNGNMDLTLDDISSTATPALLATSGVIPGETIRVGDSVMVNFRIDYAGHIGPFHGTISWSFREIPEKFSREFSIPWSVPQSYEIALTTPPAVSVAGTFDLAVRVTEARWPQIAEQSVKIRVEYNPNITRFDLGRWSERSATVSGAWRPEGDPVFDGLGSVTLTLVSDPASHLDSVLLLPIPFQGFLGNTQLDTFRVTMTPGNQLCAVPADAEIPYRIDSICGLTHRLFEFTGDAYSLRQNMPNPTRGSAEIEFTLGMEGATTLELFAADGRLVQGMVNQVMPSGTYRVRLELTSLPSGVYYYRLNSGPFSAVRQLVIEQ